MNEQLPEVEVIDKIEVKARHRSTVKDINTEDTVVKHIKVKDTELMDIELKDIELKDIELKDIKLKDKQARDRQVNHNLELAGYK